MPKGQSKKSSSKAMSAIDARAVIEPDELSYIVRSVTIFTDMDDAIKDAIKDAKVKRNRETRSSIIDKALRAYFSK